LGGKGNMSMDATVEKVQRYRAKAARRPILFWWQAFLLLGVAALLWSQLPVTALLYEVRVIPPLPDAHVSYVTLDPAYAAHVFTKTMMARSLSGQGEKLESGIDLGTVEMDSGTQPPEFLEQGARYPGSWQPAEVYPLVQRLPDVTVPVDVGASVFTRLPEAPHGVRTELDQTLTAAAFSFPVPSGDKVPARDGHCRFYLETEPDGTVVHLLLLTPRTESVAVFEQALSRGQARGAARGVVELFWKYPNHE